MASILIVDDSVVMRKLLREAIEADAAFDVRTAANGKLALAMMQQVQPDLVVLDIEMPELNGLETLQQIRRVNTALPVVMFSSLTERGAEATIDSLMRGATDYVTKPFNDQGVSGAVEAIRRQLIPKIRALCGDIKRGSGVGTTETNLRALPQSEKLNGKNGSVPISVLAIGSSTGGPNALTEVVSQLPGEFPVPIVVVQHMPPVFTRFLAERLDAVSQLSVREAEGGEMLKPGDVWIAPGDFHLGVKRDGMDVSLEVQNGPQENSCRPSVDVLFRSVASAYPGAALAVVLTGMGQDGLAGARRLAEGGSTILAQDEATSVVWGMPGFVVRAGLADKVLPISELAAELVLQVKTRERFRRGQSTRIAGGV
jgi:two-component system chemotaxis response regulator CheB